MEKRFRIMMVDDNSDFLFVTRAVLEPRYEVFVFDNGKDLLRNVDALKPDLLILDVGMPDRDGLELCGEIASEERYQSLPILLLSACAEPVYFSAGAKAGASSYLTKPVRRDVFLAKIEEMLDAARRPAAGARGDGLESGLSRI